MVALNRSRRRVTGRPLLRAKRRSTNGQPIDAGRDLKRPIGTKQQTRSHEAARRLFRVSSNRAAGATADGGVNIALVLGPWFSDWRRWDVPSHGVSMTVNGELKGHGTGARALGDPMDVLIWLANQQSRVGRGLEAGAIVTTGTCTGLDAVRVGDRAMADFGELGSVAITFIAQTGA